MSTQVNNKMQTSPSSRSKPQQTVDEKSRRSLLVFAFIFLLSAITLSASALISYKNYEAQYRVQIEDQLSSIAKLKAEQLSNLQKTWMKDANFLYNDKTFAALVEYTLEAPDDQEASEQMQAWLETIQADQYSTVSLFDIHSNELLSVPNSPQFASAHLKADLAETLQSKQVTFFDFHFDEEKGPIYIAIMVPILGGKDGKQPIAVVELNINPENYIYPFISEWPVKNGTAESLIVRREGNEVLFLNNLKFKSDSALSLHINLKNSEVLAVKAVLGQTGITEGVDYRGESVIGDLRPIPDLPWYLITKIDIAEIYAPLQKRAWELLLMLCVLLIGLAAVLGMLWWRLRLQYFQSQQAEETLRQSEEGFEAFITASDVGTWDWNIQTGETIFNERWAQIVGYTLEELFPISIQTWMDLAHPEDLQKSDEALEKHFKGKTEVYEVESRMKHKSGKWVWVLDRGKVLTRTSDGKPLRMLGTHTDITARKKSEEIIKSKVMLAEYSLTHTLDEVLQLALDKVEELTDSQIGFFHIVDKDQINLTLHSWSTQTMRDFCKAEGKGAHYPISSAGVWVDCIREKQIVIHNDYSKLSHRKGLPSGHAEVKRELLIPIIRGEQIMAVYGVGNKSFDYNAEDAEIARQFSDLAWDIAARKMAEEETLQLNAELEQRVEQRTKQLEISNKELEAFSYSVSHDLRTPLRAITGYTNILTEDYEPLLDQEGKRVCTVIKDEAQRMGQLIDDLLSFSRLGRKEIRYATIDMQSMAQAIFNEISTPETREHIEFKLGKLPEATGDSALIHQVWINFLSNAIKFTSKKDRAVIEITGMQNGCENIYSVRDNGAGFDMEYADKLFGVFQRLHSESEFEGTGVGLAIIQRIILRHGGRVWAEGQVGQGAEFHFTLPVQGEIQ